VLKYELFRYNIVVAPYPVFGYLVSRAGRQVDWPVHLPPCTRNNVHIYRICCRNNIITKKFIFLTR